MDVKRLVERLTREARITVLTGAGVSAASGVPTFRGADGLWKNFRPETLATAEAFGRDPKLVWEWYAWRRSLIAACEPNAAHRVLADWSRRFTNFQLDHAERRRPARVRLARHGGQLARRSDPSARFDLGGELLAGLREGAEAMARRDAVVRPRCRRAARIAAVRFAPAWSGSASRWIPTWFGKAVAGGRVRRLHHHRHVGRSSIPRPDSSMQAKQHGAFTVEINPEATPATSTVDLALRAAPSASCPRLTQHPG